MHKSEEDQEEKEEDTEGEQLGRGSCRTQGRQVLGGLCFDECHVY